LTQATVYIIDGIIQKFPQNLVWTKIHLFYFACLDSQFFGLFNWSRALQVNLLCMVSKDERIYVFQIQIRSNNFISQFKSENWQFQNPNLV